VRVSTWLPAALAALLLWGSGASADTGKKPPKEESSFGALKGPEPAEVHKQALAWLKSVGKADAATQEKLKVVWAGDRALLDKVVATLALGDKEAAKVLAEARDFEGPAPTTLPALLKDTKKPAFLRANLAVAYGKALTGRKVYEEALEALALVKPEDTVDPSAYLFHKAVCEHALMLKDRADSSIDRLLVDATDAPERYRMVAALMHFDMLTWQDRDLGWVARKMGVIRDRLEIERAGKETQRIQKEVLVRLDEMIKELENKQKQQQKGQPKPGEGQPKPGNGGECPEGDQPGQSGPPKGYILKKKTFPIQHK